MTPKPQSTRERQARFRDRQRAMGRVRKSIWINPADWPEVERLVKRLNEKRERNDGQ